MNATKDGYEWYPVLAKDMPKCLDASPNGYGITWKFHVRTGADGLKYSTASTTRSKYNGRGVELEDYVTAFKLLLNGKANFYRGSEMAGDSSNSAIVGAASYFNATKQLILQMLQTLIKHLLKLQLKLMIQIIQLPLHLLVLLTNSMQCII